MTPTQALITRILKEFRQPVYRTKIVKLAYLIDYVYYRNFGRTLTGLRYMWDDYGPNAVGNAIVAEAGRLVRDGVVYMGETPNQYGDTSFVYGLLDRGISPSFTPQQEYIISQVLDEHKRLPLRRLIARSKATKPFQNARQYSVLKMERDTPAEETRSGRLETYERSLEQHGTKSLGEIKGKYRIK